MLGYLFLRTERQQACKRCLFPVQVYLLHLNPEDTADGLQYLCSIFMYDVSISTERGSP